MVIRLNGFWGADAQYYARRSDGACFAIDGAAKIFDLAVASSQSCHVRELTSLPQVGRFELRVFAAQPIDESLSESSSSDASDGVPARAQSRLFAYGVRRQA